MKNIKNVFDRLDQNLAFVPFVTAGYPDLITTEQAIKLLDSEGADIIEIGLPYSDPLADGPIIQEASSYALKNGIRYKDIFNMLCNTIPSLNAPVVLFTYYNPILNFGTLDFIKKISEIGVKGLLVPDLPLEESYSLSKLAQQYDIDLIMLIAPTSSASRIKAITEIASGCIYLVSSTGVTGSRKSFSNNIKQIVDEIKYFTKTPIILGFGISSAEQIYDLKSLGIQGIVMGSAFVKAIKNSINSDFNEFQSLAKASKKAISS
uniref:tryptophan synthase alpha subunit n=1 Tax=Erythrolobus coxiae TaxID=362235 RepID=UPI001FCDAABE|nr:tryptophan synthase alpha subunit [Erythrolobus coxiae]UNJ17671.1 tryptophan synthase alpha subunit [Erythrolobus coxiae]